MNVYIIIPYHNEENFIEATVKSIIQQSYKVKKLLFVNDNSNDKSSEILKKYVENYDWINKIDFKSTNQHLPGEKVINAFNFGLNYLDGNYNVICKFDADIILPKNYIEKIITVYNEDSLAGMVSGLLYIKKGEKWVYEKIAAKTHVRGPIKSYRKKCFKKIGGLKKSIGWDTVDVLLSKYNNFNVITIKDLIVKHQKHTGSNYNNTAKYLQGSALYKMRFGFILSLLSAIKRSYNLKDLNYLKNIIIGYAKSKVSNDKKIVNREEGKFIRRKIWSDIFYKLIKW
ncbi:MAG: glycosyltransferase [Flavobacteriaceae bacterium]|nr:glycosyltransferase [Flavobacteriaceae bacterium]